MQVPDGVFQRPSKLLPYRLILRGDRIDGLVTQSDLLKLPVRIVVFGLLTHLETVMADLVSTHWPGDDWMTALSPGRRAKLLEKETALRRRGLNPPRIELTEFADKRDLCKRLLATGRKRFEREMDGLRNLRDQLAHAATFVDDDRRFGGDRVICRQVRCGAVLATAGDDADRQRVVIAHDPNRFRDGLGRVDAFTAAR